MASKKRVDSSAEQTHRGLIGCYRRLATLGQGSFGTVYLVQFQRKRYALKIRKLDAPPDADRRIENEIWALQQLDHPSIPRLVDHGKHRRRRYYVMSLADGLTLKEVLKSKREVGGWLTELQVIQILSGILEAVVHMHDRCITHRDIKHENVVFNEQSNRVWLIDVGCCAGPDRPNAGDTFWNIGASRFAPPSKLKHPTVSRPSHDTFAIGVLGYILVTGEFPWSVEPTQDRGHLCEMMERLPPLPIEHYNNTISPELCASIQLLIAIDDDARPKPLDALRIIQSLEKKVINRQLIRICPPPLTVTRVVRDPLHGDVRMSELEWAVLSTPEFQRLRWMKQLGFANLVYPGAEHTRFHHSIGTLYVADRILNSIKKIHGTITGNNREDDELQVVARLYALVHDATHIAFGHSLEDELCFFGRHDANEARIARLLHAKESKLGNLLKSSEPGREVLNQICNNGNTKQQTVKQVLASSSGADVIDYVDRDSFFCGLSERVDPAIFRRFVFHSDGSGKHVLVQTFGKHGRRIDLNLALENLRLARFALFMKVYMHPVKVAATAMLGKCISLISEMQIRGFSEAEIEKMGDAELLLKLRECSCSDAADLAAAVLERRLYKPVFISRIIRADEGNANFELYQSRVSKLTSIGVLDPVKRHSLEAEFASGSGLNGKDVVLYCSPKAPGYAKARFHILNDLNKPQVEEMLETELLKRHSSLWHVYCFCPAELMREQPLKVQKLVSLIESTFMRQNELSLRPEQRTSIWSVSQQL